MQLLMEASGPVLTCGVLLGLFVRRKLDEAWVLPLWLAAVLASDTLKLLVPAVNTWTFWIAKELVHDALYLLLGIELAAKLYAHLPWSAPTGQRLVVLILAGTVVLVATAPAGPIAVTLLPRLTLALAFLYVGLYATAAHQAVPLGVLHRMIMRGFTLRLCVFTVAWARTESDTWLTAWINAAAYGALLLALLYGAWKRDTPPVHSAAPAWVGPWALR